MTGCAISSLLLRVAAWAALALALASVSACSTLPELQVPKEVKVPTPAPCVDPAKRPRRPTLAADADLLAMDEGTRTLRAWADRQRALAHLDELEAVVEGCSRIPAPPPRLGPPRAP